MNIDQNKISKIYKKLIEAMDQPTEWPPSYINMTKLFDERELWREYLHILSVAPAFEGGVVVDIGSKYGHVLPLFHCMGAKICLGVDVDDNYISTGNAAFRKINFPAVIVKSDEGYLPIDSESVDFVFVNEVISHVNPVYLDVLFSEISRILKVGGAVLISDGNNRANPACVEDLNQLYFAWENGPVGFNTGRDVVDVSFLDFRKRIISKLHPELADGELDYLAQNTSGLFGERLVAEVDKYFRGEGWVERPYRRGICPTNPGKGGVVMERAFHPIQIELALAEVGIRAKQSHALLLGRPGHSVRNRIGRIIRASKIALLQIFAPMRLRGPTWSFQILGIKMHIAPADWRQ